MESLTVHEAPGCGAADAEGAVDALTRVGGRPCGPQTEKRSEPNAGSDLFRCLETSHDSPRTVWSNNLVTHVKDDVDVRDRRTRVVSPVPQRRRITARLRAQVIEHYNRGSSGRRVAATLGLGRTTVLKILNDAGVSMRPRGPKYYNDRLHRAGRVRPDCRVVLPYWRAIAMRTASSGEITWPSASAASAMAN